MEGLSPYERSLINNAGVINAKNKILEKVSSIFAELSGAFTKVINERSIVIPTIVSPKISRGEKYHGLPYLVLDYPRLFTTYNTLAIRTLFWWGNYFSITLQLQGVYQIQLAPTLNQAIKSGVFYNWFIQVKGNMYQHAINEDYQLITNENLPDLTGAHFIKITKKIPLDEWDRIDKLLLEDFKTLVQFL